MRDVNAYLGCFRNLHLFGFGAEIEEAFPCGALYAEDFTLPIPNGNKRWRGRIAQIMTLVWVAVVVHFRLHID
jgi:hypothetical protein